VIQAIETSNIVRFPAGDRPGAYRPVVERAVQEPSGKIWVLVDVATWERLLSAAREL
jgi:hypothetical protein